MISLVHLDYLLGLNVRLQHRSLAQHTRKRSDMDEEWSIFSGVGNSSFEMSSLPLTGSNCACIGPSTG